MSDEKEKPPRVVKLHTREPYVAPLEQGDEKWIDEEAVTGLEDALERARTGHLHTVLVIGIDPSMNAFTTWFSGLAPDATPLTPLALMGWLDREKQIILDDYVASAVEITDVVPDPDSGA